MNQSPVLTVPRPVTHTKGPLVADSASSANLQFTGSSPVPHVPLPFCLPRPQPGSSSFRPDECPDASLWLFSFLVALNLQPTHRAVSFKASPCSLQNDVSISLPLFLSVCKLVHLWIAPSYRICFFKLLFVLLAQFFLNHISVGLGFTISNHF